VKVRKSSATAAATVFLLLSSLLVAVPSASAVTLTTNLAGRPIKADTLKWCTGIAYGKINNKFVLFTANHCNDGIYKPGTVVNGSAGRIGVWGGSLTGPWAAYDLNWIVLDSGAVPSNPHQIYRGNCNIPGGCVFGTGTSSWWTVNNKLGNSAYSCANMGSHLSSLVAQNWRTTQSSTTPFVAGEVDTIVNGCEMLTSIDSHCPYKDSGSGLTDLNGEVIGIGHASTVNCGGQLIFTSFYEGLKKVDAYYDAIVPHIGAWLCVNTACT